LKRRFNYTGRKTIPKDKISITLNKEGNNTKSFQADLKFERSNFPNNAVVYVEAYHKTENKRYNFGTIWNIIQPINTSLSDLAYIEDLKFRVLVVDETSVHGRIIAHADKIKPVSSRGKKSILPVRFCDLGQQIWRVVYSGDEDSPVLELNENIPGIHIIAKNDPQFTMLVYPAVIREILKHMVFIERIDSISDPSTEWHKDWLDFVRKILPNDFPENLDEDDFDNDDILHWIDKVIEEFCNNRNEWSEYVMQVGEG